MFDLDVRGMLQHLKTIKNTVLLVSNPCVELWFLLHYEDCKHELDANSCVKRLKQKTGQYVKGVLTQEEKRILLTHVDDAIRRANVLEIYGNPSTTVYRLILELNALVR